ncbi:DEAD/DEAH box helicase [Frigoribacterium sp. CFBP 8754]|uniref:DEAD/DEAH box helicase n=1 Tax=Frigoribacterium sp. CFBP 8754 TaxID=2775290 RepID=UPI00178577F8|nr:DEAD/DEAH box helicase [Frigoribacterium sp. CFBP 8754]MBD8659745.1 DEAD/DEAH box helicase [Frigoribacterium sp. CFBP 8754]
MPLLDVAPLVDAVDVIRFVGPRPFAKGRQYSREDRVRDITYDPVDQVVTGTVRGSAAEPYRCEIVLQPTRGEQSRPSRSTCTCPLGGDCKHVAAVLLANNAAALAPPAAAPLGDDGDLPSPRAGGGATGDAAPSPDDWRARLGGLTGRPAPRDARTTSMGLLFELRPRVAPPRSARWDAPRVDRHERSTGGLGGGLVSGSSLAGAGGASPAPVRPSGAASWRLGVRPVSLSPTGNWVRGDLTWTSLPYQMNRLAIGAEQHAWFGQFAALHRSVHASYVPGEADWLMLDDFTSPLLWPLLAEARRLGVALVTGKRATDVTVAAGARVTVDARTVPGRGLVLSAGVTVDGEPHAAADTGTIGDHGVYVATPQPHLAVVLAPTVAPLAPEQRQLLTSTAEITVPEADAEEFLRDWYPGLQQAVAVTSRDESVALPEVLPPQLVLTASFSAGDALALTWRWVIAGRTEPFSAHETSLDLEALGVPARGATLKGVAAAEFVATRLPELEARDDLRVVVDGERPDYRELTEAPHLTVTTVETDKRDWFDLGVLVTVEGRTVPLVPLLTALARRRDKMLLVDKSYLSLAHPAFDELKRLIDEATGLDEWEAGPRINRYQASLWSEFDDLADATVQADAWRSAVGGLLELAAGDQLPGVADTPVPAGLDAELRPYQLDGFRWLAFLHQHGLGGVLADDMGLGKTVQTLALVAHVREEEARAHGREVEARAHGREEEAREREARAGSTGRPPFLVVAPTSVVPNWASEAARFTPGLRVHVITETEAKSRRRLAAALAGGDVDLVVTSYALFRLDAASYSRHAWAGLVLDEAQFVKNPSSQAHRRAVELEAPFKLAITGTPLENSLTDLWALFHVVAPGLLSTHVRFSDDYVKPIATGERPELLARLRARIRPLMLRRTKELVAADLPAKQEQLLRVDLAPAHRELYDAFLQRERLKLLDLIDDLDRNRFIVFRSLTLLRMLALDAALIDPEYSDVPSAKLDQLLDELDDVVAEGHRALVFSQFTSFLGRVAERLEQRGTAHEYLDGSTRRRGEVIERFKGGASPVFLISLKAGGFGLNLTEADYVFMLDPWWNPASESQAVDRTHRIGQTKNVMVYRLIANDTVEEKVLALQQKKAALFDAVVDDDAVFSSALTADDIRGLLD